MEKETIEGFTIVGLAVRTTNENGQAAQDIPALWNKFMSENILAQISDKADQQIYCMYTEYEDDFRKPYTTILGCKVANNPITVPEGLVAKFVPTNNYTKIVATANLQEGAVYKAWTDIWNSNLNRAYQADFEVYGSAAQDPNNASVDIFISVN
ncbi:AraC family transcriptional regulator [Chryseotalea sanaruensis]|uniref:AraC family transcriptional regulator n=1 Tax=Chryseotalea sanaruensis TaxID=2482724 RepID=A0A401UBH7_9BACT|nr:GyrI-like domain-containing protein [Chryseotalea sanaruensis]GCC52268.1 AraC family transcriptional regulator [Chryseotalea sanaruensis]